MATSERGGGMCLFYYHSLPGLTERKLRNLRCGTTLSCNYGFVFYVFEKNIGIIEF